MPAFHLNPNATEFIPGSLGLVACPVDDGFDHPDVSSMVKSIPVSSASSEDFMELRAVDAWLNMMVDLEELEQDHLISLALSMADPARLEEIHRRQRYLPPVIEEGKILEDAYAKRGRSTAQKDSRFYVWAEDGIGPQIVMHILPEMS